MQTRKSFNIRKIIEAKTIIKNISVSDELEIQIAVALYNKNILESIGYSDKVIIPMGDSKLISANILSPELKEENISDYKIKVFVLNSLENMKPLLKNNKILTGSK